MVCRTVTPANADCVATASASCDAPIQTNNAINIRIGWNRNRPTVPIRNATPFPIPAATRVAQTRSRFQESNARSTRPPSIGNAGIRLKSTRKRFATINAKGAGAESSWASNWPLGSAESRHQTNAPTAITTFTRGPATAINSSCRGVSPVDSIRASPPMGSSVTSRVRIPNRLAISTWPNSWRRTQPKIVNWNSTLPSIPCHVPDEDQPR